MALSNSDDEGKTTTLPDFNYKHQEPENLLARKDQRWNAVLAAFHAITDLEMRSDSVLVCGAEHEFPPESRERWF
eukprot:scaffold8452_cov185-Ochromonas_danica.AAC.12